MVIYLEIDPHPGSFQELTLAVSSTTMQGVGQILSGKPMKEPTRRTAMDCSLRLVFGKRENQRAGRDGLVLLSSAWNSDGEINAQNSDGLLPTFVFGKFDFAVGS